MEGHYVHFFGCRPLQQAATRLDRAAGHQIEAILPLRMFQVQRMYGRISQVEQLPAV